MLEFVQVATPDPLSVSTLLLFWLQVRAVPPSRVKVTVPVGTLGDVGVTVAVKVTVGSGISAVLLDSAVTVSVWLSPPPAVIPVRFTDCAPELCGIFAGLG